jgi:hypothetical protein
MKLAALLMMFFSFQVFAGEPLMFEPVTGSCPKVMKKEKYVCHHADGSDESMIDIPTFPATASKEIKTSTQTCDREQSELLLKYLDKNLDGRKILKTVSCTAFQEEGKSSNVYLIEVTLAQDINKDMNAPWKKTLLAKKSGKDIEPIYSRYSAQADDGVEISLVGICDTDDDKRADLIIQSQGYFGTEITLIFKNLAEKGFSSTPIEINGKPGCGC